MVLPVFTLFVIIASFFLNEKEKSKPNLLVLSLIFISMVLICTFRSTEMADAQNYIDNFYYPNVGERFEFGYLLIRDLAKILSNNYRVLFFLVSVIALFLKFKAILKISPYVYGSLLIYLSYFFILHDMIQIRAGIAAGFILFSIKYIVERNLKKFIIFTCIACCFHISSLVVFLLWFVSKIKYSKLIWISIIPLSYVLVVFFNVTLGHLIPYIPIPQVQESYKVYTLAMEMGEHDLINIFNMLLIGKMFICTYLILYYDKIKRHFFCINIWLMIYIIALSTFVLFKDIPVVAFRIAELLQIVEFIIIPTILYTVRSRFVGKFLVVGVALVYLLIIVFYNKFIV